MRSRSAWSAKLIAGELGLQADLSQKKQKESNNYDALRASANSIVMESKLTGRTCKKLIEEESLIGSVSSHQAS